MHRHAARASGDFDQAPVRSPRGASACHSDGRANRICDQVLGCAHLERAAAVRLVAAGLRRDGHVDVVIAGSETAAVLVLLDACDIGEEGNPRYIVELQCWVRRVARLPAMRLVGAQLSRDIDVGAELPAGNACWSQVGDTMAGSRAHRPPLAQLGAVSNGLSFAVRVRPARTP